LANYSWITDTLVAAYQSEGMQAAEIRKHFWQLRFCRKEVLLRLMELGLAPLTQIPILSELIEPWLTLLTFRWAIWLTSNLVAEIIIYF
jgi:hypothetical protein